MKLISISLTTFAQRSLINDDTSSAMLHRNGIRANNKSEISFNSLELPNYKSNYDLVACLCLGGGGQVVGNYKIELLLLQNGKMDLINQAIVRGCVLLLIADHWSRSSKRRPFSH